MASSLQTQLDAAAEYFANEQFSDALSIYKQLLGDYPRDPDVLNDAGLAYYQLGRLDEAIAHLERALDADPGYEGAFFNLLDVTLEHEGREPAAARFERFASGVPASPEKENYARRLRTPASSKNHIFIITQPRSGSTIFWQMLRQDPRLTCYNEPFNPHLRHQLESGQDYHNDRSETHNGVFKEFFDIPDLMAQHWSCMQPEEELYPTLIGHQIEYIQALLSTGDHCCIDFLKCNSQVDALRAAFPEALIIHLVRDPRSWVTSHLRPYGDWLPNLPEAFFQYQGWFNYWSRQQIAEALEFTGFAHQQLLQVWNLFVERAESQKPDMTIQFERFATSPEATLRSIYEKLSLDYQPLDCSRIHSPNPPFRRRDPAWQAATRRYLSKENQRFIYRFSSLSNSAA